MTVICLSVDIIQCGIFGVFIFWSSANRKFLAIFSLNVQFEPVYTSGTCIIDVSVLYSPPDVFEGLFILTYSFFLQTDQSKMLILTSPVSHLLLRFPVNFNFSFCTLQVCISYFCLFFIICDLVDKMSSHCL